MKNLFILLLFTVISSASFCQHDCVISDEETAERLLTDCSTFVPSVEDIQQFSNITFYLAFHFVAQSDGDNFTCDQADPIVAINGLLYAPDFINQVVSEMNTRMENALILDGNFYDTKIRFELINGSGECESSFFYDTNSDVVNLSNAINLRFSNDPNDPGIRAFTFYGSNKIVAENVVESLLQGSNNTWDLGRLINHEFGHTRNLKHSFNCSNPCNNIDLVVEDECCGNCWNTDSFSSGCFGCSERNLMMGYGTQTKMTPCELEQMWGYILSNNEPYQSYDFCGSASADPIIYDIESYEVWDSKKMFPADVRLKSGTTIEITCDVFMGENTKIYVEEGARLIVNGGKITNLCESLWSGIKIAGGNSDFDIEVKNGSVIENTNQAAITMWPTNNTDTGNGVIKASNSIFSNVKGGIGLWSRGSAINSSTIDECQFMNAKWGIGLQNVQKVKIENSAFQNIQNECVYGFDCSAEISGNDFNSQEVDVIFNRSFSGLSSKILDNSFNGASAGYISVGPSLSQNEILDNTFTNPEINILHDGYNNFLVEHNDFYGNLGVVSMDNEVGIGDVGYNSFYGNFAGISALDQNNDFNFYENCFSSLFTDVYIDGAVSNVIHSGGEAANNCFSHQGTQSVVYDMFGVTSPFSYFEPDDGDVDCRDVLITDPDIDIVQLGNPELPSCASKFQIPPFPGISSPCHPNENEEEILASIEWLERRVEEINANPFLSAEVKERLIALYKRCLKRVKGMLSEYYLENGEYLKAKGVFDDHSIESQILAFGVLMTSGQIEEAENMLADSRNDSYEWGRFKQIQKINLRIRKRGLSFDLSKEEASLLRSIVDEKSIVSSFAKSILYQSGGEVITSEKLTKLKELTETRSDDINSDVSIVPNPVSDYFTINKDFECTIKVFDITGRLIFSKERSIGNEKIDAHQWKEGMYVLTLTKEGQVIHTEKIISL